METLLQFLNDQPWAGVVFAIISLASAIAAITPTPKEGTVVAKLYKVIDFLALNFGQAKSKGEEK
jgi:hypothetical protein